LQKQLKCVAKQTFEFRNTRNGTRVITKEIADFQAVRLHFDFNNFSCYSFFSKTEEPIKVVIRHLPINTPAEDIAEFLGEFGFEAVSVRRLSTTRRSLPPPFVPYNSAQDNQIQLLPYRHQGRGIQISKSPYAVLQLPEIWTSLGKLQATSPLLVVWRRPPALRLSGEGQLIFNTGVL
jgi:hypothetical protein